jgi:hypothetical protein
MYDNTEAYFQMAQEAIPDPETKTITNKLAQTLYTSKLTEIPDEITEEEWKKKILW